MTVRPEQMLKLAPQRAIVVVLVVVFVALFVFVVVSVVMGLSVVAVGVVGAVVVFVLTARASVVVCVSALVATAVRVPDFALLVRLVLVLVLASVVACAGAVLVVRALAVVAVCAFVAVALAVSGFVLVDRLMRVSVVASAGAVFVLTARSRVVVLRSVLVAVALRTSCFALLVRLVRVSGWSLSLALRARGSCHGRCRHVSACFRDRCRRVSAFVLLARLVRRCDCRLRRARARFHDLRHARARLRRPSPRALPRDRFHRGRARARPCSAPPDRPSRRAPPRPATRAAADPADTRPCRQPSVPRRAATTVLRPCGHTTPARYLLVRTQTTHLRAPAPYHDWPVWIRQSWSAPAPDQCQSAPPSRGCPRDHPRAH